MVAVVSEIKFTEARLEQAIIDLLGEQGYPHVLGQGVVRTEPSQVLIVDDLRRYLALQYQQEGITPSEIQSIIRQLQSLPASDLYQSNKTFCHWLSNGFLFKREDRNQKDLYIELIDTHQLNMALAELFTAPKPALAKVAESTPHYLHTGSEKGQDSLNQGTLNQSSLGSDKNIYKLVNQLEIEGTDGQKRIPDGILYVNGMPLVVFEFKSAVRLKDATVYDAWRQICVRYKRDLPQLLVYNAFTIISDGVNNKLGNVFAPYEYYYAWRKETGFESAEKDGINSLYTMIQGLLFTPSLIMVKAL